MWWSSQAAAIPTPSTSASGPATRRVRARTAAPPVD
jgi:hypothetical protein